MTEPVSTAVSGYIISKSAAIAAALLGAISISFFYQPKRLHSHGKLAAGAMIGGIAVSAAFATSGAIAHLLGLDFKQIDTAMGIGYIIGLLSVGVIGWVANFLEKKENSTITEVITEIKDTSK